MLKGIPQVLSPELLKILAEMGHGDEICIGDANFPGAKFQKEGVKCIRADGIGAEELLDAVLQLMPLDDFVEQPVKFMERVPGDETPVPIWDHYRAIIGKYDRRGADAIQFVERFSYYEQTKNCYCVVMTGETKLYANLILKKGVVRK